MRSMIVIATLILAYFGRGTLATCKYSYDEIFQVGDVVLQVGCRNVLYCGVTGYFRILSTHKCPAYSYCSRNKCICIPSFTETSSHPVYGATECILPKDCTAPNGSLVKSGDKFRTESCTRLFHCSIDGTLSELPAEGCPPHSECEYNTCMCLYPYTVEAKSNNILTSCSHE